MNRLLYAIAAILILSISIIAHAEATGFHFTMIMASPGQDDATYVCSSLGDDMSLEGKIGNIATKTLLSGGKLYALTPAIKTFREIENPDPPAKDSADWPDWLLEPGRVNPLKFADILGQQQDLTDSVRFGAGGQIEAKFDHGRLVRLSFPSPSGEGNVVYSYSDFAEAPDLKPEDFQVPSDYSD
jgi:hypothetical protein